MMFQEKYYDTRNKRYVTLSPSSARALRSRGWNLTLVRTSTSPASSGRRTTSPAPTTKQKLNRYYDNKGKRYLNLTMDSMRRLNARGWDLTLYPKSSGTGPHGSPRTGPTPQTNSNPYNQQQNHARTAEVQRMAQELKNLKAWITTINTRVSQQLVDLGGSTSDRRNEIVNADENHLALEKRLEAINERVSQQLVDLGDAATAAQQDRELIRAQIVIDDVTQSGSDFGSGVSSFFSNPSTLILVGVAVMALVMIKK